MLYEVLDALYFDRKAVSILRDFVNEIRIKTKEIGCKNINESIFFKELDKLTRKRVINLPEKEKDEKISLFEVVLMYCNSLPAQNKDVSEMRIMIKSVIEMIHDEIALFTNNPETVMSRSAEALLTQFNLLVDNYKKNKKTLSVGNFSDDVVETAQGTLIRYFKDQDLMKYVEKIQD